MSAESQTPVTPSFAEPPVIETAIGVTFESLERLTNAHQGAYWVAKRDLWPHVKDAAPAERQIEQFDDAWIVPPRVFRLSQDPSSRLALLNPDRSRAIQVQQSGFDYSWIKAGATPYPRYGQVRDEFDREWESYLEFLLGYEIGPPVQVQWEITYVNKIAEGSLWNTPNDWPKIFSSSFGVPWESALANLESFSTQWHFQIPDRRGRLHVNVSHATHEGDNALMLVLTARGPIDENVKRTLSAGIDLGRRTIVDYFKSITSTEAHKHWKIES